MNHLNKLVKQTLNGNEEAFKSLFDMSYQTIYFKVNKIVMDEASTMDILQNTYIKAYESLAKLDEPKAFLKWLNVIATNETKDYLKKRKDINLSALDIDEDLEFEIVDESLEYRPDAQADIEETKNIVNRIISKLPETQRAAIMMYYFEELKISEISEILDVSENTVKSRLRYAKESIEKDVIDLEKNSGVKLYGFAPIAFFVWYLKESATTQIVPPLTAIATAATTTAQATTAIASKSAATKIAQILKPTTTLGKAVTTTIVTATLAVSGVAGVKALNKPNNDLVADTPIDEVLPNEEIEDETVIEEPKEEVKPPKEDKPQKYQPTVKELEAVKEVNKMHQQWLDGPTWLVVKQDAIYNLKRNGFTEKEALYGVNNSNFDWDKELKRHASYFHSIVPGSYNRLLEDLELIHTKSDAKYSADNLKVDWKNQPYVYAESLRNNEDFSRVMLFGFMENQGKFSKTEIDMVRKNFKVDWKQEAVKIAKRKLQYNTPDELDGIMTELGYTNEEIVYAREQLGI